MVLLAQEVCIDLLRSARPRVASSGSDADAARRISTKLVSSVAQCALAME